MDVYKSRPEETSASVVQSVPDGSREFRKSYIRQSPTFQRDVADDRPNSPLRYVLWPILLIGLPITILTTILLAIVFAYRVQPQANELLGANNGDVYKSDILVNFSASEYCRLGSGVFLLTLSSENRLSGELSVNRSAADLFFGHVTLRLACIAEPQSGIEGRRCVYASYATTDGPSCRSLTGFC